MIVPRPVLRARPSPVTAYCCVYAVAWRTPAGMVPRGADAVPSLTSRPHASPRDGLAQRPGPARHAAQDAAIVPPLSPVTVRAGDHHAACRSCVVVAMGVPSARAIGVALADGRRRGGVW